MRKTLIFIGLLLVSLGATQVMAIEKLKIAPVPVVMPIEENPTGIKGLEASYRLESVLENQKQGKWNGLNTVRKAVQIAIEKGVPANTIVLLLLLPLIATLVSMLHYLFGLSGYGLFMPTMIAVTFLVTGVFGGLVLFGLVLGISVISGLFLKKLKLHFWPARAINLMFISCGTFVLMILSSYTKMLDLTKISIFPMLLMILLVEEFVRTQLIKSRREAVRLTVGTLVLAILGSIAMNFRWAQETVLVNPELTIILVLAVNLLVGNYTGMRLMEIKRFRKAIRVKGTKNLKSKA